MSIASEFEEQLANLDEVLSDPFIERVVEQARVYNQIFSESTPTQDEYGMITQELNSSLGNVIGSSVLVSGLLVNETEDGEVNTASYDDLMATMNGFTAHEMNNGLIELVYSFNTDSILLGEDADIHNRIVSLKGKIDTTFVSYSNMSVERARALISAENPDLFEGINEVVYNAEGSEAASILGLGQLKLKDRINLEDEEIRKSIEIYLLNLIKLDAICPYTAKINGLVTTESMNNAPITSFVQELDLMIGIDGFTIRNTVAGLSSSPWEIHLACTLIPADISEKVSHHYIPLSSIVNLESTRAAFYGQPS